MVRGWDTSPNRFDPGTPRRNSDLDGKFRFSRKFSDRKSPPRQARKAQQKPKPKRCDYRPPTLGGGLLRLFTFTPAVESAGQGGELALVVGSLDQNRGRGLRLLPPEVQEELEVQRAPLARPEKLGKRPARLQTDPSRPRSERMRHHSPRSSPVPSRPERSQLPQQFPSSP